MALTSFVVHYKGSTTRVSARDPLAAIRKVHRAPKGQRWTATLSARAIRESAIVLRSGKIVGRAVLEEKR